MNRLKLALNLMVFGLVIMTGCGSDESVTPTNQKVFGIFSVQDNQTTVLANGEINTRTLNDFNQMIAAFPQINLIQIQQIPGSLDDDTNVLLGREVFNRSISTHVLDNGLIASGGVDFYLAGKKRTLGQNTMVGVHSWSTGTMEATDFPTTSPEHDRYINYYKDIGFSDQLARDFYFFTINAAPAATVHYMTAAEIQQYEVVKE